MTTAEKRADLQARGEPWPTCDCHDLPLSWNRDPALNAGGRFRCRVEVLSSRNRMRNRRRDNGECVHCGGPLATESMCRTCADSHADLMATPAQRLKHQFVQARHRQDRRAEEGFRPTGVGLAAFAAWTERTGK